MEEAIDEVEELTHEFFFSAEEEAGIITAIQKAESQTCGEIRVHLEDFCLIDPLIRSREVFEQLKMNKTHDRNGVLIYIAIRSHTFAIFGDEAVFNKAGEGFWKDAVSEMKASFLREEFSLGVMNAIQKVGDFLQQHFHPSENKSNQLPDEISYGNQSE